MKITSREVRDVTVVSLEGRIPGEAEKKQIQEVLNGVLSGGKRKAVVDLTKTEWMSSAGIGALVGARQSFEDVGAQIMLAGLTEREREILESLSKGMTNQQLAENFEISLNTVKFHLKNLYGKMGVENRAQAVAKYLGRATR